MDLHEAMVKARADLVDRVGLVLEPIANVARELRELRRNLVPVHTDVLAGLPRTTCPFPDLPEHLLVQLMKESSIRHIDGFAATRPEDRVLDVLLLELVEFALRGDIVRDEALKLLGLKRGRSSWVVDFEFLLRHFLVVAFGFFLARAGAAFRSPQRLACISALRRAASS